MAILNKEQIFDKLKGILGERTDDEALSFLEDIKETVENYEIGKGDKEDWKSKYEENDKTWREKYRNAFFGQSDPTKETSNIMENADKIKIDSEKTKEEMITFNDLFGADTPEEEVN